MPVTGATDGENDGGDIVGSGGNDGGGGYNNCGEIVGGGGGNKRCGGEDDGGETRIGDDDCGNNRRIRKTNIGEIGRGGGGGEAGGRGNNSIRDENGHGENGGGENGGDEMGGSGGENNCGGVSRTHDAQLGQRWVGGRRSNGGGNSSSSRAEGATYELVALQKTVRQCRQPALAVFSCSAAVLRSARSAGGRLSSEQPFNCKMRPSASQLTSYP